MTLLDVQGLTTAFMTGRGEITAIEDVSFSLKEGEILGIVGESGSGKSVTALTIMGLLPRPPARIAAGSVMFQGQDLTKLSAREMQRIRGPGIAMIFQEPMTSLNPVFSIGDQIMETIRAHENLPAAALRKRAIDMLDKVGIPSAARRLDDYPHQMSGGQRQRVGFGRAWFCRSEGRQLAQRQRGRGWVTCGLAPVTAAEAHVGFIATDLHLSAIAQGLALGVFANNHRGFTAAMTDGADFAHFVGEGEEGGGTGEEFAAKIHPQAISHDGNVEIVDNAGQLPDLVFGQELCLVEEDAGDGVFG